jgi:hypothetical protein
MHVLLQPAGAAEANKHFVDTILNPVPVAAILSTVPPADVARLREAFGSRTDVPTWGVTPGEDNGNATKWERIQTGDLALFARKKKIFAAAHVLAKVHATDLAVKLWQTNDKGETWEYVYFLGDIAQLDVTYEDFNRVAGYKSTNNIQGFNVLDDGRSARIASALDLAKGTISLDGAPAALPSTTKTRGLNTEYPRMYTVAGIHLAHKLLNVLSAGPKTLDDLELRPNDVTFEENVKHPRQRVSELVRFAAALELVTIDDDNIALSPLGAQYQAASGADVSKLSNAQTEILRTEIIEHPQATYTFAAIVALCRMAAYRGHVTSDDVKDLLATELGAERLNPITRKSWATWTLKCCDQLRLTSGGEITKIGQAFLATVSASIIEAEIAPTTMPALSQKLPERRNYHIGKSLQKSTTETQQFDQESWHQARDRRTAQHRVLTDLVAAAAKAADKKFGETNYIDLWVDDDVIIEVKSLANDDVKQARAALAQLLHYRHLYRDELPPNPKLVAVFSRRPVGTKNELMEYLTSNGIVAVWPAGEGFTGSSDAASELPWLISDQEVAA